MQHKFETEAEARHDAERASEKKGAGLITVIESRGEFFAEDSATHGFLRNWERDVALYRDGREVDSNDQPV